MRGMCGMGFWGVAVDVHIDGFVPPKRASWECAGEGVFGCRPASESLSGHRNARVPLPSVKACSVLGTARRGANP